MSSDFNPYVSWLNLEPGIENPNYYQMLGVPPGTSDKTALKRAYVKRVASISAHQHGNSALVYARIVRELAGAYRCLTDDKQRASYDQSLAQSSLGEAVAPKQSAQPTTSAATIDSGDQANHSTDSEQVVDSKPMGPEQAAPPKAYDSGSKAGAQGLPAKNPPEKRFLKPTEQSDKAICAKRESGPIQTSIRSSRARRWKLPLDVLSVQRTPTELLNEVVKVRGLTPYQAKLFLDERADDLLVGSFIIESELPISTFGQSFVASSLTSGQLVTIRTLPETFVRKIKAFRLIIRRCRQLASKQLQKPVECGVINKNVYLASEFAAGEDLRSLVRRTGPLSPQQAILLISKVVEGLIIAANAKLHHGEIRPNKVIIDNDGNIKLRDLALSFLISSGKRRRDNLGNMVDALPVEYLQYAAPEALMNESEWPLLSDIYSLGCVLFFALMGSPPFPLNDRLRLVIAHREAAVPRVCSVRPEVPPEIDDLLSRMLAKQPKDRFESYVSLHGSLRQIYSSLPNRIANSSELWQSVLDSTLVIKGKGPLTGRIRRPQTTLLAFLVTLVVIGFMLAFLWHRSGISIPFPSSQSANENSETESNAAKAIILKSSAENVPVSSSEDEFSID